MVEYKIHPSAGLVPMATEAEQEALTLDIKENGQREEATLYRGRIVDGRCRYKACNDLGIELKVKTLPNNMSISEVEAYVKSVNTRRNLTRSQKVITAYREMLKTKLSGAKTAERWGLDKAEISNAKFISVNRPDYAEKLFQGENIKVGFDIAKNKPIYSSSIARVRKFVEEEIGAVNKSSRDKDEVDEIEHLKNMIRLLEKENEEYRESNTEIMTESEKVKAEIEDEKRLMKYLINKYVPKVTPDGLVYPEKEDV